MARLLIYYAHPGNRTSRVNRPMVDAAKAIDGITIVDLYRLYPRYNINVAAEQERILGTDVFIFQCPLFWYSTPSLIKEWIDLVLQHGFAYGSGGDRLTGKTMMLALTAAGPVEAYRHDGYQRYPLRTFLTPLEQTAHLCHMRFAPPYVLHSSLSAPGAGEVAPHVEGYQKLLRAIRDDAYDFDNAAKLETVTYDTLPMKGER